MSVLFIITSPLIPASHLFISYALSPLVLHQTHPCLSILSVYFPFWVNTNGLSIFYIYIMIIIIIAVSDDQRSMFNFCSVPSLMNIV